MSEIIVIYDGKCELCKNSVYWIRKKLEISAFDFHIADLSQFNLSKEQCAREVFAISGQQQFSGAKAVAFLLKRRGNKVLSALLTISGPLGRIGYQWVARNRNSLPVKALSRFLSR
jgi:predicted DCC family thiol-disulfide oxidoreductase YuxK